MQRNVFVGLSAGAVALLFFSLGAAVNGAQHEHPAPAAPKPAGSATGAVVQELKIGKEDDVTFTKEVRVGEVTLMPGDYRLQHRVEGADHFLHFEALVTTVPSAQKTGTGLSIPAGQAGEIKCRLEPLPAKVKETKLHLRKEEGGQRLLKVMIRGENVAHVF